MSRGYGARGAVWVAITSGGGGARGVGAGLTAAGQFNDAIAAALAVIRAEPLLESACIALVCVHLAEGNQSEAIRAFDRYRALLAEEIGVEPTARLSTLISSLRRS